MANDDDVGIIRDHPDGVGEAFAFCGRARIRIGARDVLPAEAQHGAFKGQARARARLIEQCRQYGLGSQVGAAGDPIWNCFVRELLQEGLGQIKNRFDLFVREIVDGDDVTGQWLLVLPVHQCARLLLGLPK